ncbi:MAG TPA: flagellar biosynthesis protein FliQ [Nitrospirota bacterium]|jgi:flagellar biosynthetic protein FliQ
MTESFVMDLGAKAIETAMFLAAPILGVSLVVGVVISVIQAVTQINEMTLSFIPKIIAVVAALVIFFPWMLQLMMDFTTQLFMSIPGAVRG